MQSSETSDFSALGNKQVGVLLASILIVALCGIAYELIIGTISSYLLGNSVYQFSFTIGFFMFAMGIGSLLSKYLDNNLVRNFILVEMAISLIGGISSILLFMAFPLVRALYELIMYSLILSIGILVGLEIPILTTILSHKVSIKKSIAHVMSLDYVGALIGAVAFPLFLLPTLGLLQSSFAIGLINIFTALVNVVVFRDQLKHYKWLLGTCFAILFGLIAFIVFGTVITSFAEKHLYFDQVVFSKQTPYQKLTVTKSVVSSDQRLYIDGHIQFSSRDEYRYHEALVHPIMSLPGVHENILILGGGDGLAVRELLKYEDVKRIDLVDIDPEMTRIARELPMLASLNEHSLDSELVTVYNEDAFSFINAPGQLYDRVIVDMPDPHNEAINKLYSKEFYTMVKRRMTPEALLVSQSSSPFFTRRTFWCIERTMNEVFGHTLSYHTSLPSFGIWGFNLASSEASIDADFTVSVPTRAVTEASMQASLVFTKDMAKIDSPVNSIMVPKLYQLYIDDLK
ncbi:MAG: spermidine synthase [Alteromonadaceae bacterium]|nr:MAG: spermidine synthase [Alteromonadaceae bacterium]